MYRIVATLTHKDYEPFMVYADVEFNSKEVAESWIHSKEGYNFEQDVMIGIDVHEYAEGYVLEGLSVEGVEILSV